MTSVSLLLLALSLVFATAADIQEVESRQNPTFFAATRFYPNGDCSGEPVLINTVRTACTLGPISACTAANGRSSKSDCQTTYPAQALNTGDLVFYSGSEQCAGAIQRGQQSQLDVCIPTSNSQSIRVTNPPGSPSLLNVTTYFESTACVNIAGLSWIAYPIVGCVTLPNDEFADASILLPPTLSTASTSSTASTASTASTTSASTLSTASTASTTSASTLSTSSSTTIPTTTDTNGSTEAPPTTLATNATTATTTATTRASNLTTVSSVLATTVLTAVTGGATTTPTNSANAFAPSIVSIVSFALAAVVVF